MLASRLVGSTGKVVAFEPDPVARRLLELNVAKNRAENVTVVPFAVGHEPGTVRFVASGDSVGRIDPDGELEVRQVALDSDCKEHDLQPDVMKVDIEGGEAAALEGSTAAFLDRLGDHELIESPHSGNYAVVVKPRVTA
jgi:FkbM family methyltransferase